MSFNPNELILERVRTVEEYDPATDEIVGRYTQIEEPSLTTSAEGTQVVDAMGAEITTFYNAQTGEFTFTNSLHSLDLLSSQWGVDKEVASDEAKIPIPVSEIIPVAEGGSVTLKYVPIGTKGAEIKYVKVINDANELGETYKVSSTAGESSFTIDAENKKITLPEGVTGKVFVNYTRESAAAVRVVKRTDSVPQVRKLLIHAIFHDKCNTNLIYAGVIIVPRAQINPESVEVNLTSDGKHGATYRLQKDYCDEDGKLFEIVVSED